MLQIVRFNWLKYAAALAVCALSLAALAAFPALHAIRWAVLGTVACAFYWTFASLLASHWIYDRSKLCEWAWIKETLLEAPRRWANIHAGLDESSASLRRLFPGSDAVILDIFDPTEMTELSIAEARRTAGGSHSPRKADFRALPFRDAGLDAVFLILAAHEIRRRESRLVFFKELHRVLRPGGRVLLVEHLRDLSNFLAFGPGCFHFHSRRVWLNAAQGARLEVANIVALTPFVKAFLFRKSL